MKLIHLTIRTLVLATLLSLASCVSSPQEEDESSNPVGILIFGDTGYHLDYPDQDDYVDLLSAEGFQQMEWQDWLEDKRPEHEFEARPSSVSPVTGQVVAASGLHAVSSAMTHFCEQMAVCDFGVMLGDNIYPSGATFGADGFDDADRFKDMLQDPLGSIVKSPETYQTYVTLGNHDWETSREGGFAQIDYYKTTDSFYIMK